ncbi:CoF synthetase [Bacillus salipaludis]|uniref:CoF synthetase n=1 Tax=Bacillus salipaludis TaxID=2547811 RepID=A0A4R5VVM1_9BACI|nr:CoF synthetase [Bacillus salipaludis]MDQ6597406.1 CoF synthetase [Bacillus salipaludis]TDK63166.1 CoF synthetase [Bacillus salipaludis]
MRPESQQITNEILQFIHQYPEGLPPEAETNFNELAIKLFNFQFKFNLPYKKFCQTKRKTPLTVKNWRDIPAIPLQGFKEMVLSSESVEDAEAVFMTSGTTNPNAKGKNYHPTLAVWDASMKCPFKHFVLPDVEKITMFVLSPAANLNQNSSLSRYLTNAVTFFGTENSRFFFNEKGLDMEGLTNALKESEERGEPILLIGATFAYVHVLDYLKEKNVRFQLGKGSRIFDTGGFKGQSREIEMDHLYYMFKEYFHVDRTMCINMYGMTELSSQIYDQTILSNYLTGTTVFDKTGPAWVKTIVLDANTLEPVSNGVAGVIAHYDLANWNSCQAILTEDLGYRTEEGFVLLGRVKGSEARGCSIAIDQLLQANGK